MRGPATAGNSKLFKDFCNEAEMEKNNQIVGFILTSSLRNLDMINSVRWRSYFSFFQPAVAGANIEIFKDFITQKKRKRTSQVAEFIMSMFLTFALLL